MEDIRQLQQKIGYHFNDIDVLKNAVTHSSYIKEHDRNSKSNERLECLGDAFFDAIIGEELYRSFPEKEEGILSRTRATLVCEKSLANEARRLDLGKYIMLGNGEEHNGGRFRESILADTMEAVIGAVYLDVKTVVLSLFDESIKDVKRGKFIIVDYKTTLQEKLQNKGEANIKYVLLKESGPDHDKTFQVQLEVNGRAMTKGTGKSKKQAEQSAAKAMLEREL